MRQRVTAGRCLCERSRPADPVLRVRLRERPLYRTISDLRFVGRADRPDRQQSGVQPDPDPGTYLSPPDVYVPYGQVVARWLLGDVRYFERDLQRCADGEAAPVRAVR